MFFVAEGTNFTPKEEAQQHCASINGHASQLNSCTLMNYILPIRKIIINMVATCIGNCKKYYEIENKKVLC